MALLGIIAIFLNLKQAYGVDTGKKSDDTAIADSRPGPTTAAAIAMKNENATGDGVDGGRRTDGEESR